MTEVFTPAPRTASPNKGTKAASLPLVECAAWCRDGNGHPDAIHHEDQWCATESERIELDAEPIIVVTFGEGSEVCTDKPTLDAYLAREAYSTRTLVHVSHNEEAEIHMTPAEAIAHGEILIRLARLAQA